MPSRVVWSLTLASFLVLSVGAQRAARADVSSLDTIYFEVGYVQANDAVELGGTKLSGAGVRYYERHCCLARSLATITVGLVTAIAAASRTKSVSSKTERTQEGGVIYEKTTTTTTFNSDAEMAVKRDNAANATTGIMSFPFTMELIYFPERDDGQLHGWQWTVYLLDWPRRSRIRLETGFHWDKLRGEVDDPTTGMRTRLWYRNVGVPVKLVIRPIDWVQLDVEWRWNWTGEDEVPANEIRNQNQMLRGSITVQAPVKYLDLLYGRITAQSNNGFDSDKMGLMLELGMRL